MKTPIAIALFALSAFLPIKALSFDTGDVHGELVKVGNESISASKLRLGVLDSGHKVEYLGIFEERHSWRITLNGGQVDGGIVCHGDLHLVVEGDTTLKCSGSTCGIDVDYGGALCIEGPGKLRIECQKGAGIRCTNSGTLEDIKLEKACVEIVGTDSKVGYGIYTDYLFVSESTLAIILGDGSKDAILCRRLDIGKSVVMASGGKRGLYAKGSATVSGETKAEKEFPAGAIVSDGYVRVANSALYLQGETIGAAVGDYEHLGTYTTKGGFSAKDSVVVVGGLGTDGICCGGSVVFDNVAGSIRAAQCAVRAFDDIDIKGGCALHCVGNVADPGSNINSSPNLGAALLVSRTGTANGSGGGAINVCGGETTLFSGGCVGAFTPGVFSITDGKVLVSSGKRTDDMHRNFTASDGAYFRQQLSSKAGISPPTSQGDSTANAFLRSWKPFGDTSMMWAPVAHGIDTQVYKQTGGTCIICNASDFGILLGWKHSGGSSHATGTTRLASGKLMKSGGTLSIDEPDLKTPSTNTCISSLYGLKGTSKMTFSGGPTTLIGGLNCLVCNGEITLNKGTVNYYVRRPISEPTIIMSGATKGMGVYANKKITVNGGSLAVMGLMTGNGIVFHECKPKDSDLYYYYHGAVSPRPRNKSGTPLYRAIFPVGKGKKTPISGIVPSNYNLDDLYPADGNLMFWLPASNAKLICKTRREMTFRTKKKGSFSAMVLPGTYCPSENSIVQKHDENVFVPWHKVKQSVNKGLSIVFMSGSVVTLPNGTSFAIPSGKTPSAAQAGATPKYYTVKFNANGGKLPNGKKLSTQKMVYGKTRKLSPNKFKRGGYVFLGWAKSKKGKVAYRNKAAVRNLTSNGRTVTLYAKWAKKIYKVKFYANGGKGRMSVLKMAYGKAQKLSANKFKRKGYVFKGWAKSKALARKGKVAYRDKQAVKNLVKNGKTVKLYAAWDKKSSSTAKNSNDADGGGTASSGVDSPKPADDGGTASSDVNSPQPADDGGNTSSGSAVSKPMDTTAIGGPSAADDAFSAILHVDASAGSDANGGSSWASAKRTIQAAIDSAPDDSLILVADGTYGPIVTENRKLTIRSLNGAGKTRIDGGGTSRCATLGDTTAYYHENTGWWVTSDQAHSYLLAKGCRTTVLNGFTLVNGYTRTPPKSTSFPPSSAVNEESADGRGGGAFGGTLVKCVISGNSATIGGGAYDAELADCVIRGNTAVETGGGLSGDCSANRCAIEANGASSGGGAYGGTLANCLVAGNTAGSEGGGTYCSNLRNCTVTCNVGGGCSYPPVSAAPGYVVSQGSASASLSASTSEAAAKYLIANCIVWGNTATDIYLANVAVVSSCSPDLAGKTADGNIIADPCFVDAGSGNYRLASNSPCVNAGSAAYATDDAFDLDCRPRVSGTAPDMGCYEW